MSALLYFLFKIYLKIGLFFYSKKINILGKENVPKKGPILFTANHPNALIDPLLIATNTTRKTYFLVRAAVFKKKIIASFLNLLGMMPIYRIRDGVKQLSKNEEIFNNCQELLKNNKSLLIFPEGSHSKKRTIRPISKGFTRIVYRTLDKYPDLKIYIIPVGITYQNSSKYPSEVTVAFGKPIIANDFYNTNDLNSSVKSLKNQVHIQLKKLTVHIEDDENYSTILTKLNNARTDFTAIDTVNLNIKKENYSIKPNPSKTRKFPLFYLIILNSFFPYLIWKLIRKKIDEIEFIDTFRFGLGMVLFPLFYFLQGWTIYLFFNFKIALLYTITSFLLVLIYTKTSNTKGSN
ncbi:lysophospholipid acyltransferase family protein [Tenacibaculum ovolyticum]|uniref:lysophospholipid acyltransferase family protein n=1 Tax=Tenacibaculum ovolyticum TaxID=104270 RepID=UPI001F17FF3B|nr:lysophospholipid acyltransferase family protein [Tenacibaculum ovolyticum]